MCARVCGGERERRGEKEKGGYGTLWTPTKQPGGLMGGHCGPSSDIPQREAVSIGEHKGERACGGRCWECWVTCSTCFVFFSPPCLCNVIKCLPGKCRRNLLQDQRAFSRVKLKLRMTVIRLL